MLFSDSYHTLKGAGEAVFKDRGSKFIAYAFPAVSETEIREKLQALRKQHPSARHHCYAWRLGPDKSAWRSNDDGEPSGSAGKPVLGQILSHDLTNALVVVVRYFGGTLLGVGGLVNAYKSAAAAAIAEAGVEERFIVFEYQVEFAAGDTSAVMRLLKEYEASLVANEFTERSRVTFRIRKSVSETVENKFRELYATKLSFIKIV